MDRVINMVVFPKATSDVGDETPSPGCYAKNIGQDDISVKFSFLSQVCCPKSLTSEISVLMYAK